jgi:hypothetical protein
MIDTDEKEMFAEELAEHIVNSYDRDSLERIVWDVTYEELSKMSWVDLRMTAEDYGLTPRIEAG